MRKVLLLLFLVFFTNLVFTQTKQEKKQLKEEKANKEYATIKKLIETNTFVFNGTWLTTRSGRRIDLNSGTNHIEVKKDSTNASLQFFGEVRSIGFKSEGGIVFDNVIKNYKVKYNDKKRRIQISFSARNKTENFEVSMTVHKSGFTFVDIFSSFRSGIKYEGTLDPIKKE